MSLKHRMDAYLSLLNHYKNVFRHSWNHRHLSGTKIFNHDEAEFLPAALSLQEKPVSPTLRNVAKVLILLLSVTIIWSILGKIDIIVNGMGKVIPSERTKVISSADVAILKTLYVKDGQNVKKGDLLMELDTSAFDAEYNKANDIVISSKLQIAHAHALLDAINKSRPPLLDTIPSIPTEKWEAERANLDAQYRELTARIKSFDDGINHYESLLQIAIQQAQDYKELSDNHDVALHDWQEKEKLKIETKNRLMDAKNQKLTLISETKKSCYDTIIEATKALNASNEDAYRSSEHSKSLKLTSPVNGTVQQLSVYTLGAAVPATQPLMEIVPDKDRIEIEAFVENKDIGFLEPNQNVIVKIDTFDYTKYGTIPGKIITISRDAIEDQQRGLIYSVKVLLDKTSLSVNGKKVQLSPGMSARIEIKTGTRRIIEYFLSPLLQHQHESLHER